MTARIAQIWRHPIKAIGRERVASAVLEPGKCLPWDRTWAVAHDRAQIEGEGWQKCMNFTRAASSPRLMAVEAHLDEVTEVVTLMHPDQPPVTLHPERDAARLLAWVAPLIDAARPAPARVLRAPGRGMTDSGTPGVTIGNLASHRAVEQKLGRPLSLHRWRANIWLDGLAPWEEFDWVDQEITLGDARLHVYGRTTRCRATESNPDTGVRDADTLGVLRDWGHSDFTVKAQVITGGTIVQDEEAQA